MCDAKSNARITEINQWCRNGDSKFILANARGLFGVIFCDLGNNHCFADVTGCMPNQIKISTIEKVSCSHLSLIYKFTRVRRV